MDDKDIWAVNLARQVKSRQENEEQRRKQYQADRELIFKSAPGLWEDLQKDVQDAMHALNTALGQGTPLQLKQSENNKFELFLQRGGQRVLFTFEPAAPKVRIGTINSSWEFEIKAENGHATWVSQQVGSKSSEQIAKDVLADTAKFI